MTFEVNGSTPSREPALSHEDFDKVTIFSMGTHKVPVVPFSASIDLQQTNVIEPIPEATTALYWYFSGPIGDQLKWLAEIKAGYPMIPVALVVDDDQGKDGSHNLDHLSQLLSSFTFDGAISPSASIDRWNDLQSGLGEVKLERVERAELKQRFKKQNQQLEHLREDLEKIVDERTQHIAESKEEMAKKISDLRYLLHFAEELTTSITVEDIISLLKSELRKFSKIKSIYLAHVDEQGLRHLCYFHKTQVLEKKLNEWWPQTLRIRSGSGEDSQFLANMITRPVAQVLTVPLQTRRLPAESEQRTRAVLYFEHMLSEFEVQKLIAFLMPRLQPMAVAIEKVVLEHNLSAASRAWERTFDGLRDSVAIVDEEGGVLRCNSSFKALQKVDRYSEVAEVKVKPLIRKVLEERKTADVAITFGAKIFDCKCYPILLSENSAVTTVILHFVDITVAHNYKVQIMQNEKIAAVGQLAGNIAHELNNPLTGIRSLSQVMIAEQQPGTQIEGDLKEVERAADRCQLIINNLLEFSQGGVESRVEVVDLNEVVEKTLPLLKTAMRHLNREVDLHKGPLWVRAEPQLLQQVVFNLVNNACQATEESGVVKVETTEEVVAGEKVVKLVITDTGSGIGNDIVEKIFEPFFTTKKEEKGTGLGLSMSKKVIEEFSGKIEVHSQTGKGSEFVISLPAVPPTELPVESPAAAKEEE